MQVSRMCFVCRTRQNKDQMLRLTKVDGKVVVDNKKQQTGKGAYICFNCNCEETMNKKRALNRVFKCDVAQETYNKISEELKLARKQ